MAPERDTPARAAPLSRAAVPAEPVPAGGGTSGGPPAPGSAAPPRWRSSELFGSAQEVEIEHGDAVYRLRRTALGKLIMTK